MQKLFKTNAIASFFAIILSVFFVVSAVQAATTISTNISTGGTLSVTATSTLSGKVGILTSSPLAPLQVGAYTVNNSVDSQVLVSRQVDNTVTGNGHAFSDSSDINRSGTIGYNSFDGRTTFSGSNNYDHYAAFQAGPTYGSAGTITNLFGLVNIPAINSGTVTNSYGVDVWDPTGAGTLTNNYGVHVASLTKGTNNFAIYTDGTTKSYFGGKTGFGTTTPVQTIDVTGNSVVGRSVDSSTSAFAAIYDELGYGYIAMQKRGSTEGGLMGSPAGNSELFSFQSNLGLLTHTAGTYLALGTANTERMRITATGNVGIGTTTPATKLHVSSGASATTTVSIGELGLTSSKACVNMNRADGGAGSFYISAAGAIIVETNYCR